MSEAEQVEPAASERAKAAGLRFQELMAAVAIETAHDGERVQIILACTVHSLTVPIIRMGERIKTAADLRFMQPRGQR
jgi:hypothetical protein